jgi:hypothetical protein
MYAPVKPAKVSVYVKLSSCRVPGWNSGVQFGFGHGSARSRSGLTDRAPTRSLPFLLGLNLDTIATHVSNVIPFEAWVKPSLPLP